MTEIKHFLRWMGFMGGFSPITSPQGRLSRFSKYSSVSFMANNRNDHYFFYNSQPLHSYQCFNCNHFYHKVAALPKAGNVEIEAVAVIGKQQKKQIMHLIFLQFKIFSEILKNHEIWFLLTMKNIFAGAVNVGSVLINGMAWKS